MLKAYKCQLYPTKSQRVLIDKTFGCCRVVYNRSLYLKNQRYSEFQENLSKFELSRILTFLKTTEEFNWLKEVNSQSLQAELRHLDQAFTNFFRKNSSYPKFKKKNGKQSFECPQNVYFKNKGIKIPKLGRVKCRGLKEFDGKIKTCTVSKNKSGKYFISILVDNDQEIPNKKEIKAGTSLGLDVGLKEFAIDSKGNKIENPKFYRNLEKKLAKEQRKLSRKQKGSSNRNKQRIRVAKINQKIVNQRNDFLQKLSSNYIKNHDTIIIEDLNIKGMIKNRKLSKSIQDASWSEFFRMLTYKAEWYGKNIIKIGRFEPSSKMCSCGEINKDLKLSDREWTCKKCNVTHDRDILAAQNIKKFGLMKLKYNTGQDMPSEPVEILT